MGNRSIYDVRENYVVFSPDGRDALLDRTQGTADTINRAG
jgi:hypothetical protein